MADYNVSISLSAVDRASPIIQNLNVNLSGIANNTRQAANAAEDTKSTWDRYKDTITNVGIAWGTLQIAGRAVEFVQLGNNINGTTAAFQALADVNAPQMLQEMRNVTNGVATDFELMRAANRYMQLGIANSSSEVSTLVDMAITLGRVMGQDASESIEAFGALLANQSIPRLDNFGISSARVRDRVNELKDAGYDAQEAFKMAVMEQGAISLERLGDAADAGVTGLDRLSTRWGNFVNTVASGAADILEQAFGTLDMISRITDAASNGAVGFDPVFGFSMTPTGTEASPYGQFAGAAEAAQAYNASISGGGAGGGLGAYQNIVSMEEAITMAGGALVEAANASAQFATNMQAAKDAAYAAQVAAAQFGQRVMVGADLSYTASQIQSMNQDIMSFEEYATMAGGAMVEAANASAQFAGQANIVNNMNFAVLDGAAISANMMADGYDKAANSISDALISAQGMYDLGMFGAQTTVGGITYDRGAIGDTALFTPEEAQYASEVATYYSDLLADATLLHEQGLISDTELANVQSTADAALALADQAERGAQAFENMTLSQAFGTGGLGGMQGEMAGDVLGYMQDQGVSDADITQWEMATGTETLANMAYEQTIIPMIADIASTYGAEAGAAAIANVQTFLQNARMTGMSDAEIALGMGEATGYEYAYQQYDPTTGPYIGTDMSLVPADTETSPTDDMTAMEISTENIATQTDTMKSNMEAGAVAATSMKDDMNAMATRLTAINGRSLMINLRFNTSAARGELAALIREIVGDNGGSVPGGGTDDHPGTGGT